MYLNKIFKIVLIVAISIIAFSISYYYVILLPQKEKSRIKQQEQENLLVMKEKCRELGEKLYNQDIEELGKYKVFNPEYHFNQKLNTCLYIGGRIDKDYLEKWVKDSLTNKPIIMFIEITNKEGKREVITFGCSECLSSNEEFEQQKQKLLSE